MSIWLSEFESESTLDVLLVSGPPNTKLPIFIEEFEKLFEVTINGRDIQLSGVFDLDTEIGTVEIVKSSGTHQIIRFIPVQY